MVLHRGKHLLPPLWILFLASNRDPPMIHGGQFPRKGLCGYGGREGKGWSRARITCAMQKSVEKWKKAPLAAAAPSSSRCLIQINTRVCVYVRAGEGQGRPEKGRFPEAVFERIDGKRGERPGRNGSIIDDYYFVIRCWRKGLGSKFTYGCSHLPRSLL